MKAYTIRFKRYPEATRIHQMQIEASDTQMARLIAQDILTNVGAECQIVKIVKA